MKFLEMMKKFFSLDEELAVPYQYIDEKELKRIAHDIERELIKVRNLRKIALDETRRLQSTVDCQSELLGNPPLSITKKWNRIIVDLNADLSEEKRLYNRDTNILLVLKDIDKQQKKALANQG